MYGGRGTGSYLICTDVLIFCLFSFSCVEVLLQSSQRDITVSVFQFRNSVSIQ